MLCLPGTRARRSPTALRAVGALPMEGASLWATECCLAFIGCPTSLQPSVDKGGRRSARPMLLSGVFSYHVALRQDALELFPEFLLEPAERGTAFRVKEVARATTVIV